ncbi:sugar phosphate isomerase/epimerase [Danxiaibacter flavus]|uniref:Sugar phosphate isomerase/epimerase n=1 Tax=Danxiaibacter flavus TaxID=3049108 RepID=A0ABV3ZET6_9BACT|nr:sugar phosphate isomerase/epimerase [Chitinophagaceae bacterium DXS]
MKKIACACLGIVCAMMLTQCNNPSSQTGGSDSTATSKDSTTASSGSTAGFKIGIQMWTFRLFSFEEALAKVDSAGVKHIEAFVGMPLVKGGSAKFGWDMTDADKAKVKGWLDSKGINIVAMGVISPKDVAEWKKAFDLAKYFGLSYITAEPKKDQWGAVDSLAGAYGIKVAIHDHPKPNAYWHPDSVLAAIQGHPNIGSCADIGHWSRNGLDPVDCLKKLDGHIYGVHLKDIVAFDKTDAADTVVGKGVIKFDPVFQELKRQNFNGMMSIEHESNWEHNLPDVIETVKFYNDHVAALK